MATPTDLLTLSQWFGANFPTGAFAYSHGLEAMAESGAVTDATTFAAWLRDVLERGAGRQDAILLSLVTTVIAALPLSTSTSRLLVTGLNATTSLIRPIRNCRSTRKCLR